MLLIFLFASLLGQASVRATTAVVSLVETALPRSESQSAGSGPIRALHACGSLRDANSHYLLDRDVEAKGTCFSIEADNVTLDLNGHTATYATEDAAKPTFGVLAADCWYAPVNGNPCGGTHRHITVMNGKIVQGKAAVPFSHAMRFGQASNLNGVTVHDVDITIAADDSIAIYGEYLPGGSDIYRNTIHNNVKAISNRHQFRGVSIKLDEEEKAKLPDLIHDNIILGGPQLGIRSDNPAGTKIYGNDIRMDTVYTNGFCIDAAGAGMEVYKNNCHPVHGRGLHANAKGVRIHDNTVETIDSNQNAEYGGCEINGTYGIQIENDNRSPDEIEVYNNQVKVHAAECPAEAMRLTELRDATVRIHDNIFIAVQDRLPSGLSQQGARGFSVGDVVGDKVEFVRNTVQADTAIFHMDWDSGSSIKLKNNIFRAGVHGPATLLAEFGNGVSPSGGNVFEDNAIEGFPATAGKFGEFGGATWFVVSRSARLHLTDQNGKPLANAKVETGPAMEPIVVTTDENGEAQISLPVARVEAKQPVRNFAQPTVTVTAQGCRGESFEVPEPRPAIVTRKLVCGSAD